MDVKNRKLGYWAYVVVAVMTVVCLVMYVMNVNAPYYQDMDVSVLVMLAGALVALAVTLVVPEKGVTKIVVDLARVAAAALIIFAAMNFVGMRVESFGYIYGSNLELNNQQAFDAGGQAIALIVVFVVTWIVSLVAAMMDIGKKN